MRGGVLWTTTAAVAMVWIGCSPDVASGPTAEVVDNAGVRIVTYDLTGVAVAPYASVGGHDLEIGVLDGAAEYTFSSVIDVRTSDDGSIVVADGGASELRVYDANGGYLRTLGQRGGGPGEFATAPLIAGLAGDTVFAWDGSNRRITSFSGGGDVIGTTRLQTESVGPVRVVRQDDGTYLAQSRWISPVAEDIGPHDLLVELDSVMIEHVDATGAVIDTVRVLADMERAKMRQLRSDGRIAMQMTPRPLTARAFMLSDGVRPIIGHNGSFELISYGRESAPRVVLRVEGAWPAMTAEDIRSRLEAQLVEASEDGEIDPRVLRLYAEFMPERMPDFSSAVIRTDGEIWVEQSLFDTSEGAEWLVFSASGELRGSVDMPPGLRVFEVHGEFVVGVVSDEFDVPYVRRYPLTRSRDGAGE